MTCLRSPCRAQQVLLTHKYFNIYKRPEAWVGGSFLVLGFYIFCTWVFRLTEKELLAASGLDKEVDKEGKPSAVMVSPEEKDDCCNGFQTKFKMLWLKASQSSASNP